DVFERTARAMAAQWGVPTYKFLMMPHPIANLTEAELDQRAREMAPEVARLLLEGQGLNAPSGRRGGAGTPSCRLSGARSSAASGSRGGGSGSSPRTEISST